MLYINPMNMYMPTIKINIFTGFLIDDIFG